MINFEPEYLNVYIKNGIEMPEDQWLAELSVDYFADNGCYPDGEAMDYIGYGDPYISENGNTYDAHIYYSCKTINEVIDCIVEEGGCPPPIVGLLESVKKIPNNILHDLLVGTELRWSASTRKIEYKNGRYIV